MPADGATGSLILMFSSSRKLRTICLCCTLSVALAFAIATPVILLHHRGSRELVQHAQATPSVISHVTVAPLLIEPMIDASGSMASTDPTGLRFTACEQLLKVVEAARPGPAKTFVAPIYFGSSAVAVSPYELGGKRASRRLFFGRDLGNTDFAEAIDRASAVARAFLKSPEMASGRVVVFVLTDGVPDLGHRRSATSLWPDIQHSVARLTTTGAELSLLGVTNESRSWRSAARQWRALLGPAQVRLAGSVSGLQGLYRSFAETALEIGRVQGTHLAAGASLRLQAGNYTAAFTIQATALQSGAALTVQDSTSSDTTSAVLGSRGEQRTWMLPAQPRESLAVHNVGSSPLLLTVRTEAAVLRPTGQLVPCIGAPSDGFLASLFDGLHEPISPLSSDPLALSAMLNSPQTMRGTVASSHMQVRAYAPGRYTLSVPGQWQSGAYRLTVLTRSSAGEIGRADYLVVPQLQPWANLVAPSRLTSLADASTVRLDVTLFLDRRAVRPEEVSASGSASVLAQLCDLRGRVRASVWMAEAGDGSLTASVPAVVHDGLLKLSVIDKRGRIVSTRLLLWRMRPTLAQMLISRAGLVALVLATGIILCALALSLWIVLKPALPGALVVTGAERPLRLELLGRRFKLARLSDAVGTSRWLILPASRSSLRLVRLGLHPRSTIIHCGRPTAFDGRSARLV